MNGASRNVTRLISGVHGPGLGVQVGKSVRNGALIGSRKGWPIRCDGAWYRPRIDHLAVEVAM